MSLKLEKMCATKIFQDKMMITSSPTRKDDGRIRAAFFSQKVWKKNSEITISFVGDPSNISLLSSSDETEDPLQIQVENMNYKDAIKKIIMERLQPLVNLKFVFLDDNVNTALVRIDFDPNRGSWSLLGTDCIQSKEGPTMNFAWFDVGTVLHEFGHLLGMIHEHQNPRGEKIQWDSDKVYKWAESTQGWDKSETDNNILNAYNIDHINGSDFDPLSIMLYFFPASLTTNGKGTKQNLRFSGIDVLWINKTYLRPDGPSPDIYYKSTYDVPIETSINKSKELANRGSSSSGIYLKLMIFGIICVLLYLFVTKVLLKKLKKK